MTQLELLMVTCQEFTGHRSVGEAITAFTQLYGYQPIHVIKTQAGWRLGPLPEESNENKGTKGQARTDSSLFAG